jgi:ribosomal protein S27AE
MYKYKMEEKIIKIENYNKAYYEDHKEDIKAKLMKKEVCPICQRSVVHQFMNKHKETKICKKVGAKLTELEDLKQKIKQELIIELKLLNPE